MPVPEEPSAYRSKRQLLSVVVLSVLMVVGLVLFYLARFYVAITLVGVGLGVLFVPIVDYFHRKARIPRGPGAAIVLLAVLGAAALLIGAIVNLVSGQIALLVEQAPGIYDTLQAGGERLLRNYPWLEGQLANVNFGKAAQKVVETVVGTLRAGVTAAGWVLIILLIALYVSANSASYFRGFLSVFPAYQREEAAAVMLQCADVLRKWFKGQVLVMLSTGVITTVGLRIIGVEYWLLFGAITVALSFIPYIGALVATAVATGVTLGANPDKALWVLLLFLVIQQIEGNITIPLVMRGTVELPEVHLLVLVIVFGQWLGLLGALLAAPAMAVARTALLMSYVRKMDQRVFPPDISSQEIPRKSA